jgi:glycosyltransferase involved in cell wall biosynthesis
MNLLISHAPLCVANTSVGIVGVGEEFLRVERRHCGANPAKRLVTVCRLAEPRKNVDKILRALARLKHYPFEFTVIGDGKLRHGLESLCHQLALSDRVNFTGSIDTSEIQRRLMSADLFVLTSELLPDSVEGFGIAYLEANACGTPVLAARSGGAVEAVEEGRSGYFVEETSIEAITAGLQRFLAGEVTFDSANCRAFANRFTWARVVDHACRFYPDGNGHAAALSLVVTVAR